LSPLPASSSSHPSHDRRDSQSADRAQERRSHPLLRRLAHQLWRHGRPEATRHQGYIKRVQESLDKSDKDLGVKSIGSRPAAIPFPTCSSDSTRTCCRRSRRSSSSNRLQRRTPARQGRLQEEPGGADRSPARREDSGCQCTLTSVGEKHDGTNKDDPKLEQFAEIQREIIKAKKVPYNDLRKAFVAHWKATIRQQGSGILTYDGNHWNDTGMQFVAEQMLKRFR